VISGNPNEKPEPIALAFSFLGTEMVAQRYKITARKCQGVAGSRHSIPLSITSPRRFPQTCSAERVRLEGPDDAR
jgi:hypothetical protein